MLPIHVIALDKSKTAPLLKQLQGRHITIHEAVDTRTDQLADTFKQYVDSKQWGDLLNARQTGRRKAHDHITNGSIGCYISHCKVWKTIQDKDICLVLEEDARIVDMVVFENLHLPSRDSWDVLLLGCIDMKPFSSQKGWRRVTHFLETHAYLIQGRCIPTLLNHAFPIKIQLDWHLSDLSRRGIIKIMAYFPNVIKQEKSLGTSIQTIPV